MVEPLNALLVERQKALKETKVSDQERKAAEEEVRRYGEALQAAEAGLQRIAAAQRARRIELEQNPSAQRVIDLRSEQAAKVDEAAELERQRNELSSRVQRLRAQARSLREAVQLRLHFTGLEVSLCPNCDTDVEETEVEREREQHLCRLCGKPAHSASPDELAAMEAEAADLEAAATDAAALRDGLTTEIRRVQGEATVLERQSAELQEALRRGLDYALPTDTEQEERSELDRTIGELRGKIAAARLLIEQHRARTEGTNVRLVIQEKAREVLREQALRLNDAVLVPLGRLTEEMASRIGADSITDVTCSPLGVLKFRKNQVDVPFGSVRNPGERLRVKLAFFLAMMRLGRVENAGRHPGFLMIDQPGSDEMVDSDFAALARVLRDIDDEHDDELQVICFTARPQFAEATGDRKVYGPQAGDEAF